MPPSHPSPAPAGRVDDLPTVAALAALWREVTARPLWRRPYTLTYLRLWRRMRLRPMDPQGVRRLSPRGKVNDCSGCTDLCCVGPRSTVLLRLRDLAILKDLGRLDLVAREKPRFAPEELARTPALSRQVASEGWRRMPVLRQDAMGACAALTPEGKCSLYPHWPSACERFPYALHADTREVFYSSRCDSFWIREDGEPAARRMAVAAVESYNRRIEDAILLAYAPESLRELGLHPERWRSVKSL